MSTTSDRERMRERLDNVVRRQSLLERSEEPWAAQAAADVAYLLHLLALGAPEAADVREVLAERRVWVAR